VPCVLGSECMGYVLVLRSSSHIRLVCYSSCDQISMLTAISGTLSETSS
jgi:hypothetical protein